MPRKPVGEKRVGIVYKATNKVNGKGYVGQTFMLLEKRIRQHLYSDKTGSGSPLHRAIRKYGAERFGWKVLFRGLVSVDELNELETRAVARHKTKTPLGYNLTHGGGGALGWVHPEGVRAKMREAAKKRPPHPPHTEETRRRIGLSNKGKNKGRKLSDEHRAKLRAAARRLSPEDKERLREISRQNGRRNAGKKRTEEQRRRMSEAQKARVLPPEVVREMGRKISAANMGHEVSQETREKMRESGRAYWKAHKGEKRGGPEAIAKLKQSLKRFWQSPAGDAMRKSLSDRFTGVPKCKKKKRRG